MTKENISGSGKDYYKHMSPREYKDKINTPATSREYFEAFHKPLIEDAKSHFGSPIHLIDIACGPAEELQFIKDDPEVKIIATDISPDILPHVKENLRPDAVVFASDTNLPAFKENIAEAGIIVNGMIYSPDKMLEAMYRALKPGGRCVVNFFIAKVSQDSEGFDEKSKAQGGKVSYKQLPVSSRNGSQTFEVKVRDWTEFVQKDGTPDLAIRQLGEQMYFQSIEDMRDLIRLVGFNEVVEDSEFSYPAPKDSIYGGISRTQVFTLEKPVEK